MATDDDKAANPQVEPKSGLRRAGSIGLAIINPFSDLMVIYRSAVKPTGRNLKLMWQIATQKRAAGEALNWEQAVASAGLPVAKLRTNFLRLRAVWWFFMVLTGLFACMFALMVTFAFSSISSGTLVRALVVVLVLASLASYSFVKALLMTYRLWQLEGQRVSAEEQGTFQDFKAENRWCLQVLTCGRSKS